MKFKNISKLLGITEEAAKKQGQCILRKLRSYYEEGDKHVPFFLLVRYKVRT